MGSVDRCGLNGGSVDVGSAAGGVKFKCEEEAEFAAKSGAGGYPAHIQHHGTAKYTTAADRNKLERFEIGVTTTIGKSSSRGMTQTDSWFRACLTDI